MIDVVSSTQRRLNLLATLRLIPHRSAWVRLAPPRQVGSGFTGANIHGCDNKVVTIHNAGRSRAYHYLTKDAVAAWHDAIGLTVFLRVAKNTKPIVLIRVGKCRISTPRFYTSCQNGDKRNLTRQRLAVHALPNTAP